jgi:ribonuclease P protein subunit POP4
LKERNVVKHISEQKTKMVGGKDSAKMADTYEKLYSELPESVTGPKPVPSCSKESNRVVLEKLLKDHVPPSDQKDIDNELRKTSHLHKRKLTNRKIKKAQPTKKRSKKGKYITAREKRDLGLARLPRKNGLKYADMKPLHELWKGYMKDLVDLNKASGEQLQMRLCRADYHGAHVKVTRAGSASLVGAEGFVAMETRNTFQLVGKDDVLRMVPKVNTALSLQLDGHLITLDAGNMRMKTSDRAVKKWKNRQPMPL